MGKQNQRHLTCGQKKLNYIGHPKGPKHQIQMTISPVTIQMCSPGKI